MIVIYAEKPDVASTIAKALDHNCKRCTGYISALYKGKEYNVTWGFGHLCQLQDAGDYDEELRKWSTQKYPFIPDKFKLKLKSGSGVSSQYKIVKNLFFQSEYVINATDADQEGELIFAYLYQYMNCRKLWKRLWLHSTTETHIKEQMDKLLSPRDVYNLTQAARARSESDWLVGINATVHYTLKHNTLMTLGRVQTPTLSIIVSREMDIKAHKKEKYWIVKGKFVSSNGEYEGKICEPEKFEKLADAEIATRATHTRQGVITELSEKTEEKKPPLLYNLDALQKEANKKYGYSAKETLDTTQKLYEKHLCTYPRTDWRALPEDMTEYAEKVVKSLTEYSQYISQVTDFDLGKPYFDAPTSVDSHYAIIPTLNKPESLSEKEKNIYTLLAESLVRIYLPSAFIQKTKVITEVNGYKFETKGSKIIDAGWMAVNAMPKEELLPRLTKNETVKNKSVSIVEEETKPPKRFTDATLIDYMKNCGKQIEDKELSALIKENGIGRSSTRAAIIEGLVDKKYIERKNKSLIPTEKGIQLIQKLNVESLKSPELTAKWESKIKDIREGKGDFEAFRKEINAFTMEICNTISQTAIKPVSFSSTSSLGKCPLCGGDILKKDWGYSCSNFKSKGCKFSINKTICNKTITESTVKKLLEGKSVSLKGFTSKQGKKFDAKIYLDKGKIGFGFN